jgi:RND family efflux transporter MFP subunit
VGLVALGALAGVVVQRLFSPGATVPQQTVTPAVVATPPPAGHERHGEAASVIVAPELMSRAGIEIGVATTGSTTARLRLPGEVQPDAYRTVSVTSLVAGRITEVGAVLGDRVPAGRVMARIYSSQLAEAQTAFLASRAELSAHDGRLRRTQRLTEIGAASQQELEQVHAEHTAMTTRVEAARSTLELFGLSPARIAQLVESAQVSAVVDVPAPISGVVTERRANVGLNVDPSMPLFTIVDLSRVWVVADVYERDFATLSVGSPATVTVAAYPDYRFDGRVDYIDPQVRPETRTAKLRVEVPNADGRLRLGMYVEVAAGGPPAAPVVIVPADAVQSIGDRTVVYVPGPGAGTFLEREVSVGPRSGPSVVIAAGLTAGERVVTRGAFFVRAERERAAAGASLSR